MKKTIKEASEPATDSLFFESADRTLSFRLDWSTHGVLVHREQAKREQPLVSVTLLVRTLAELEKLNGIDGSRYDHPLLFERVERAFLSLIGRSHG